MKDRKLIAYCLTENLGTMKEEDVLALDGIHIAFGLIEEGAVYWKEKAGKKDMERIRGIHPEIRLILSVGGWAADGFSQAAQTGDGRRRLAESLVMLTEEYGFDGIDIDWEYPCSDKAGIHAAPEDKENFTLLLGEIRSLLDELSGDKTLSIAAGALKKYIENTQMKAVAELLDYVQLMTYDFCGGWDAVTGHHACLYGYGEGTASCEESIRLFTEAGVPAEKIVMGAAFYSREWEGVAEGRPGSAAAAGGCVHSYDEIIALCENPEYGYRKYWDDTAKAAYLYNGNTFISYEDEQALACKAEYVRNHKLYGMMYWEYGQDKTYTLTGFLRKELNGEKFTNS